MPSIKVSVAPPQSEILEKTVQLNSKIVFFCLMPISAIPYTPPPKKSASRKLVVFQGCLWLLAREHCEVLGPKCQGRQSPWSHPRWWILVARLPSTKQGHIHCHEWLNGAGKFTDMNGWCLGKYTNISGKFGKSSTEKCQLKRGLYVETVPTRVFKSWLMSFSLGVIVEYYRYMEVLQIHHVLAGWMFCFETH